MTRPSRSSNGARRTRCRCGQTVLRQLVGRRAALDVTADVRELTAAAAAELREPNRLDWCLRHRADGPDLVWSGPGHRAGCPHPHVIDHECTAPAAAPPRPRTARTSSVPEGQIALV
ncbi:hypothetical protein [Streptomyces sp. NRRL F-5630]|uniref:hypothetical protein n=1 Tax=Streptomyces sp. NRRL F-5630 TaxID=1463864 RepID=UPI003D72395A